MGSTPKDILSCFWKYHSIYIEIEKLSRNLSVLHYADIDIVREYTERSHIRSYWPGERIFSQGSSRYHLYIITLGECEYTRTYPPPSNLHNFGLYYNGQNLQNETNSIEINIGLTLTAGHFSFMDGYLEDEVTYLFDEDYNEKKDVLKEKDRRYFLIFNFNIQTLISFF